MKKITIEERKKKHKLFKNFEQQNDSEQRNKV